MSKLRFLTKLLGFAFSVSPLIYLCVFLTLVSVAVELLAMSYLLPISYFATNQQPSEESLPLRVFEWLGLEADIKLLMLAFVVLFSLRIITQLVSQGLSIYLGKKVQAEMSSLAFASTISALTIKEIEDKSIGHFIVLGGDQAARAGNLVLYLMQFLSAAALGILYFAAIASYSITVGIAVLCFLGFTFLCLIGSFLRSHRLGVRQFSEGKAASSFFIDSLNNLRSIREFVAEEYASNSYRETIFRYVHTHFQIEILNLLGRAVPAIILLTVCGIWILWTPVAANTVNFAFIATMIIFLLRFFPVVGQGLNILLRIVADTKAGEELSEVLDLVKLKPKIAGSRLDSQIDNIKVRNICFSHNGEDLILEDFSTEFEKGKSYAVMGPSGSGKSTLIDLLVKFYKPMRGEILVNQMGIEKISEYELRKKLLVVGQRTTIFNDSIWNNIVFGAEASLEEVKRACELACIEDVIQRLPAGYETILNYQGSNLSGGQRQRIGIARALLRQPDVLVLDESTSALDSETRETVVRNLLAEFENRIVIFISHDLLVEELVSEAIKLRPVTALVKETDRAESLVVT